MNLEDRLLLWDPNIFGGVNSLLIFPNIATRRWPTAHQHQIRLWNPVAQVDVRSVGFFKPWVFFRGEGVGWWGGKWLDREMDREMVG